MTKPFNDFIIDIIEADFTPANLPDPNILSSMDLYDIIYGWATSRQAACGTGPTDSTVSPYTVANKPNLRDEERPENVVPQQQH